MPAQPPTLTTTPDSPESWECRSIQASGRILGGWRYGDPADINDLGVAQIVDNAIAEVTGWHRIADTHPGMVPAWEQLFTPDSWSGHKLHIACATLFDVRVVLGLVLPVCWRAGLGCKAAASPDVLARTGKGVVVYLPRRATVQRDASLVVAAAGGYRPGRPVEIRGDVQLAGAVWWRHEFGCVDPGVDVYSLSEYRSLYVPASQTA